MLLLDVVVVEVDVVLLVVLLVDVDELVLDAVDAVEEVEVLDDTVVVDDVDSDVDVEELVVVVVVVVMKARGTVSSIWATIPRMVAASAWVAGNSVAMMDPRANCIGMVANHTTPCSCRLLRVTASSLARSIAA